MSNQVEYEKDVRDAAESIMEELMSDGVTHRDAMEVVHETIDGCARVIYTYKAITGLAESRNRDAYVDNYGTEGVASDGVINWSALMYCAMEADVMEWLDRVDVFDINDPETWVKEAV